MVHLWRVLVEETDIQTGGRGRAAWSSLSGRRRCFARRRRRACSRCMETGAWSVHAAEQERKRARGQPLSKRLISAKSHARLTHRTVTKVQRNRSGTETLHSEA
jgi:hypothetical protein